MTTTFERAYKQTVNKALANAEWCKVVGETLYKIEHGFYRQSWLDVVFQKWGQWEDADVYDAYAFINIHTWALSGQLVIAELKIGVEPSADVKVEENNRKLGELWYPFSGKFINGTSDHDGNIVVAEPIEMATLNFLDNNEVVQKIDGDFPLEVGYTDCHKTFLYLGQEGGRLARWPYRSKTIYLLYRCKILDNLASL